ncbi:MAG: hypothetical protein LC650_00700 [Actinobacteria bacterium]|nr:hypothetical protein [Actinomycetota bacterium]
MSLPRGTIRLVKNGKGKNMFGVPMITDFVALGREDRAGGHEEMPEEAFGCPMDYLDYLEGYGA